MVNNACCRLLSGAYKKDSSQTSATLRTSMLSGGWSIVTSHKGGEWLLLPAVIEHLLSYAASDCCFCPSLWEKFVCHFQYMLVANKVDDLIPAIKDSSSAVKLATRSANEIITMMVSVA